MIVLPNVTLCCVDCLNYSAALHAIERSMSLARFASVKFITDQQPIVDGVEVVQIAPIQSSRVYSRFILKELVSFVETEFVLIIQWDGFVTDAHAWREDFLKYDYIGALWNDGQVGNGGFSLRSKRLLQALQDPRAVSQGPEDEDIGRRFRPWLESDYGIRFAPPDIAAAFSYERIAPSSTTFGFHGLFNLHRHLVGPDLEPFLSGLPAQTLGAAETVEFGLNYWRGGRVEEARRVFGTIANASADRPDIRFLSELLEQGPSQLTDQHAKASANEVLIRGIRFHQANELTTAYRFYLLALLIDMKNAEAHNLIGHIAAASGKADRALWMFKKAVSLAPEDEVYRADLASFLAGAAQ